MEHTSFKARFTLIAVVVLLGFIGIYPPQRLLNSEIPWNQKDNLKPGIDIQGGTSLLYEIKPPPGGAGDDLAQRVAEALKKRVDPDGVRNLIWRPQGATRIEIQMPIAPGSGNAKAAKDAFADAQTQLEHTNVRLAEVQAALQVEDAARRTALLNDLAMGSARRQQLFADLAKARQQLAAAKKSNDAVRLVDVRDEITRLEGEIDATNLPVNRLQSDLELFQASIEKAQKARKTADVQARAQERTAKIADLKKKYDFPARVQAIDTFVQTYDAYAKVKGKVDDAEDLKRLLRGSGVLEFHIVATDAQMHETMAKRLQEDGPAPKPGDTMRWFEVDRPEELRGHRTERYRDKSWVLCFVTPGESMVHQEGSGSWGLQRAKQGYDSRTGQAVVEFEFDPRGSMLFGELSGTHIGQPLAILLDEKVISAPNLLSRIEGYGQISGSYTQKDLDYLIKTLNAGSLPARLADEPISERTIGPTLGADNLRAGLLSSYVAVVAVAIFMIGYYYFAGFVAFIAVLLNIIILLGTMSMFNATFTLPGIAALALTVGMAVDANVLIFERLREEQQRGLSLRLALHNAYDRAFSAIFDSNITTIATSMILYWFGSEDIKGFGLTLTIGVAASMFTALFVTRAIFDLCIERFGKKNLGSLPLTFPKWDKLLRPNIDWIKISWAFYAFSGVIIVAGLIAYFSKGRDMYDIEFVSGTAVQVELKQSTDIQAVRDRLDRYAKALPAAQAVSVGTQNTDYEIVTPNQNAVEVRDAVIGALGDLLKVEVPSKFVGIDQLFEAATNQKIVRPIGSDVITVDGFTPPDQRTYRGGVAIVLKNIEPALTPKEIEDRIERLRLDPGSNMPYRDIKVNSANRDASKPTGLAVVLVSDPVITFEKDPTAWEQDVARPAWKLVTSAVGRHAQLRGVSSFDASVARGTMIDAVVAILLATIGIAVYVWIRFGSFKYGSATVVSMVHDIVFVIALLGLSHWIAATPAGPALLIEPFRMNLVLVAAILTVMGYSVNDTIIVFDRIREIRGKLGYVSRQVINDAINQTLPRTLLTGTTVLATLFVMFIWGGAGIHSFTFTLLCGILVGTYSSIAIASPILLLGGSDLKREAKPAAGPLPSNVQPARP